MNVLNFKTHCCGCGECYAVCPVNAITMEKNTQGFYYPTLDAKKCIDCALCVKHCTFNAENSEMQRNSLIDSYAMKHKNEQIREASRSGGIFTSLSDQILDANGVVYGCKMNDCRTAIHARATTKEERDAFRGSKYIQSITFDIFQQIKRDLENGLWVLFSGTACQVNAVRDYCSKVNCEKLLLVDIVCHGVPSPRVWSDYLTYIEKKHKKKIEQVDFRDKITFGWAEHKETVTFFDGTKYSSPDFRILFYDHLILREDCFECPYRNLNRVGDITIADCWGISQNYPQFDDNKGVSLVLINSKKGELFVSNVNDAEMIAVDIEKLMQPPLKENWRKPDRYELFWKDYRRYSFKKILDKYVYHCEPFMNKVKRLIKGTFRKIWWIIKKIFS